MATNNNQLTLAQALNLPSTMQALTDRAMGATVAERQANARVMVANALTLINSNTNFANVEPQSLLGALGIAVSVGLPILPELGFAAIIPYGSKAQFQIMTRGLTRMALRSHKVKKFHSDVIYADEWMGRNKLTGEFNPMKDHTDPNAKVVGYFCYIELIDGFNAVEFMTLDEVLNHAQRHSKTFKSGPWQTDFNAMALKTLQKKVLRKYAPLEINEAVAIEADQSAVEIRQDGTFGLNYVDAPVDQPTVDTQPKSTKTRAKKQEVVATVENTNQTQTDEQAYRTEILNKLEALGIPAEAIVDSFKGCTSIDEITTDTLKKIYEEETNNA